MPTLDHLSVKNFCKTIHKNFWMVNQGLIEIFFEETGSKLAKKIYDTSN